jgi:phage terminase large subunit-like protein
MLPRLWLIYPKRGRASAFAAARFILARASPDHTQAHRVHALTLHNREVVASGLAGMSWNICPGAAKSVPFPLLEIG